MKNFLTLTFWGLLAWTIIGAVVEHEHGISLMYDPATDLPILAPERPRPSAPLTMSGGICSTAVAYAAGSNVMSVMTPCSTSAATIQMTTSGSR